MDGIGRRDAAGLTVKAFSTNINGRSSEGTIPESVVALYESSTASGRAAV